MGNSGSKAAKQAGSAARQYPSRAAAEAIQAAKPSPSSVNAQDPASNPTTNQQGPTPYTKAEASTLKNEAIDLDARDPNFASRLSELGPVKPYPTYSPSSTTASSAAATQLPSNPNEAGTPATKTGVFPSPTSNPQVAMLQARQRISEAAEAEKVAAGRKGFEGRTFAGVGDVRKMLVLRDEQKMPAEEIERAMGLKKGTVGRLGRVGVVEAA